MKCTLVSILVKYNVTSVEDTPRISWNIGT